LLSEAVAPEEAQPLMDEAALEGEYIEVLALASFAAFD
jgi:hypothetical protein